MKPGRELDALVAEKVMGLTLDPPEMRAHGPSYFDPPAYSTSIAAAWEVVEKLLADDWRLHLMSTREFGSDATFLCQSNNRKQVSSYFPGYITTPHAICLGALKAVGHE